MPREAHLRLLECCKDAAKCGCFAKDAAADTVDTAKPKLPRTCGPRPKLWRREGYRRGSRHRNAAADAVDTAKETAAEAVDAAKETAAEAVDAAKDAAADVAETTPTP